jgi:hypothetical protein
MANDDPLTGHEEMISFYFYLGRAIADWPHVEYSLMLVVLSCLPKSSHATLAKTFLGIENFRAKLAFASSVVEAKHPKGRKLTDWLAFHDELIRAAKTRNFLAHTRVIGY